MPAVGRDAADYVTGLLELLPRYAMATYRAGRRAFADAVAATLVDDEPVTVRWGEFLVASLYPTRSVSIAPTSSTTQPTRRGWARRCPGHFPTSIELDLAVRPASRWRRAVLDGLLATVSIADGLRRWDLAEPYLLRHVVQHAADAGRVDELLVDPGFLVHADPATLIPALNLADREQAQLTAAGYRVSAGDHPRRSHDQRRDVLAIDAARYGAATLLDKLVTSPDASRSRWRPRRATGGQVSTALRTTLTGHTNMVKAVACTMFNGRPTAVTAGENGTVQAWDLTTGTPIGDPFTDHTGGVAAVACTQLHGRPIAVTGSWDDTVRIWDLETRHQVDLPSGVHAIDVTAAGEIVAAFGWDIVVLERTPDAGRQASQAMSARIVGVHGIGNRQRGATPGEAAAVLGNRWSSAPRRGLGQDSDLQAAVAYYAHHLAADIAQGAGDPEHLTESDRRHAVRGEVADAITAHQPAAVIAHSLGSVATYETFWTNPDLQIDLLITLGSPLALPDVVFPQLDPAPTNGKGSRPHGVRRWINIADPGDVIAILRGLAPYFDGIDTDLTTPIGVFDTHKVTGYLACPATAAALATLLGR